MPPPILAIDFGTSNSAATILDGAVVRRLAIEAGAETLPTAVFFPTDHAEMLIGTAAAQALIAGEDGRYMRALKSVLGTTLFHEPRMIGAKRRTLADIVAAFLKTVKQRAEAQTGQRFSHVLSGRPVHFHSNDPDRDARAERDLRGCYVAAGFEQVDFMFEPEAAALASHGLGGAGDIGLIVDIGGGTSDFSVFQATGGKVDIFASHGIRLGGTDFDHAVSMAHAMPYLGHGGALRRVFAHGVLPMPNALFVELSTWAKIPFLYTRETRREVEDMVKHAVSPLELRRLAQVIEDRLGHELAFSVEAAKIAANAGAHAAAIDMGFIERGLTAPITPASLNASLTGFRDRLREAVYATLSAAQASPDKIGSVILVGGSSLMNMISDEARAICPQARIVRSQAFTAVVDGLALATGVGAR